MVDDDNDTVAANDLVRRHGTGDDFDRRGSGSCGGIVFVPLVFAVGGDDNGCDLIPNDDDDQGDGGVGENPKQQNPLVGTATTVQLTTNDNSLVCICFFPLV